MEKVTINKDLCIKCGMCVSMCSECCPTGAIEIKEV